MQRKNKGKHNLSFLDPHYFGTSYCFCHPYLLGIFPLSQTNNTTTTQTIPSSGKVTLT
jgi:hypothetical protein